MVIFVGIPNIPIGIFAIASATLGAIVSLSSVQGWKRWGLAVIFVLLGIGEVMVVERAEKTGMAEQQKLQGAVEALPERIAKQVKEYLVNTAPPPTLPPPPRFNAGKKPLPPSAPTGLIVTVQGEEADASDYARQIRDFLDQQGEPPKQRPAESDIDFIVRSNGWYSNVLTNYKKGLGLQIITLFRTLLEHKSVDRGAYELAKNPVNVRGIRALAAQLDAVGKNKK